jgi:hypothetical protein
VFCTPLLVLPSFAALKFDLFFQLQVDDYQSFGNTWLRQLTARDSIASTYDPLFSLTGAFSSGDSRSVVSGSQLVNCSRLTEARETSEEGEGGGGGERGDAAAAAAAAAAAKDEEKLKKIRAILDGNVDGWEYCNG